MKYSMGYSYSFHYPKTRGYLILCCQSVAANQLRSGVQCLLNGGFHKTVQAHIVGHCRNHCLLIQFRRAVRSAKRTLWDDNSALVLVLPYPTAEYQKMRIAFIAITTRLRYAKILPVHISNQPCRFVIGKWLTDPTWLSAALSMIAAEPVRRCSMPESSKSGSSILQIYYVVRHLRLRANVTIACLIWSTEKHTLNTYLQKRI